MNWRGGKRPTETNRLLIQTPSHVLVGSITTPKHTQHTNSTAAACGRSAASCALRFQHGLPHPSHTLAARRTRHARAPCTCIYGSTSCGGRDDEEEDEEEDDGPAAFPPCTPTPVHVVVPHYLYLMVTSLAGALDCGSRYSRRSTRRACAPHGTQG
eukprot:scaffold27015_cov55-Phaeocystis_antarctica.AAC.3